PRYVPHAGVHVVARPFPVAPLFSLSDTPTTAIYTLSLHDALPISRRTSHERDVEDRASHAGGRCLHRHPGPSRAIPPAGRKKGLDRKSTRLNSSHVKISYAVFCLKKKTTSN